MTSPDSRAGTWRARGAVLRSRFRALWLVPVLAMVALTCWAFASPIGASPDDDFHLTSIWCANPARTDLCQATGKPEERIVPVGVAYATCYAAQPEKSADCQERFFEEGSDPQITTIRGAFSNEYPPVFYGVMNLFAGPDLQVSALLMRVFTALLFVAITAALYLLLPVARRPVLFGMWLLTSVPLGIFLLASNNPSSWALIGVGSAWLAALGFLETTGRRRIGLGVLAALTAVMASGARGDAAIYTALGMGLALALAFRRSRSFSISAILPVALALVGVFFFLTSQQSAVVSTGLSGGAVVGVDIDVIPLTMINLVSVPFLWTGIFGTWGLGWLDTSMPAVVWVATLGTFMAVIFATLRRIPRLIAVLMIGVGVILWVLPTFILVRGNNIVGENVQPRYLLPLIVLFAGLALLPWRRLPVQLSRGQAILVAMSLIGAHSLALHVNLRRYVTGTDVNSPNLDAGAEWWWPGLPIGPVWVWLIGSLAFAAVAVILVREMKRIPDVVVS
ncbi:MAG: DUF2142 domain-containing protein [Pseudolysinimonas sp.]